MEASLQREINSGVEIIKNKLYFGSLRSHPKDNSSYVFFTIDNILVYQHFFADFGPLNLAQLYRFCKVLENKLASGRKVFYYCSYDVHKRANAAFLVTAYTVLYLNRTAEEAFRPFFGTYPTFVPFRDASFGLSTYNLTILDCLRALAKAKQLSWVNFDTFDYEEYEHFEKVENGDLNWTLPGKFISFSGPHNTATQIEDFRTFTPEDYVPFFKKSGVTAVVRLNKKCYDKRKFTDHGLNHYDLYFPDGSTPSEAILRRFLEIAETEKGALAIHCKAGLGRTGTLISCFMMKHYRFTAAECIAWLRICRPGSVIGPQQHFLQEMQTRLWRQGDALRRRVATDGGDASDDVSDAMRGLAVDSPPRASSSAVAAGPRSPVKATGYGGGQPAFSVTGTGSSAYRSSRAPAARTTTTTTTGASSSAAGLSRSRSNDGFGTSALSGAAAARRPKSQAESTRPSGSRSAYTTSTTTSSTYTRGGSTRTSTKPRSTFY